MKKETYRNILREVGYTDQEIKEKIQMTWKDIFVHPQTKFYFEISDNMGYMVDTGNTDVRTEGQSYGMMMAVQMNRQDIFDRIWKWTDHYMRNEQGPYEGYFAWHCTLDGEKIEEGPAPDGEEFFAMALLLASQRWGDQLEEPFNYSKQAKDLLHLCLHKGSNGEEGNPMWNPDNYLIKFVPDLEITDPSYHLPHFYEIFSEFAYEEDRVFWKKAAEASREFILTACHPETGMNPEYANYDGSPNHLRGHGDFYSDSYRLVANIGLDSEWFGYRDSYNQIAKRLLEFFEDKPIEEYQKYKIDGTETGEPALHPLALLATNAMGTLAIKDQELTKKVVKQFYKMPTRMGNRRYYDNCLYFFSLLALSGNYRMAWND